ncbi:MAG: rhodanese-related sulfurtransferase [Chitinophagia bacterium]|nr:rhodanese-related sulfurtransferase [Chitinophagia bacterium]
MATLHNRVSRKELKGRALQDTTPRTTISFYCYFPITDPVSFRDKWYKALNALNVFGRIYIAHEGINAQISCPDLHVDELRQFIYSEPAMNHLRLNKAVDENRNSFYVLDIKVRNKIVADGIDDPSFSMVNKGRYVDAATFNEMVKDPNTLVIDMRNHYEYEVGRFKNAIEIPSDTFREQLPMAADMFKEEKDRNIIMYCTGGIRCEKASAWMLHNGFKNVFHLEGGIIHYINNVRDQQLENNFVGKNFVFDERLGERVTSDILSNCHICGKPCDTHVNCANSSCHLLFIQCDACKEQLSNCCSESCKDFIMKDELEQKLLRKGVDKGRNIFNKSKKRMEELAVKSSKTS